MQQEENIPRTRIRSSFCTDAASPPGVQILSECTGFCEDSAELNLNSTGITELPVLSLETKEILAGSNKLRFLRFKFKRQGDEPTRPRLQRLSLPGNQIEEVDESIGECTSLQWIDLTNNRLTKLPKSFKRLRRLGGLGLARNQLEEFPETICELPIVKLGLFENQLSALPDSIGNLRKLTKLDLCKNRLESLPESIGELSSLQWINLHSNRLSCLPESFKKLINLEVLGLGNNRLESLPDLSNLPKLTTLSLYGNRLKEIPQWITESITLERIDLSDNLLTSLIDLSDCIKLSQLNLKDNELSSLELPGSDGPVSRTGQSKEIFPASLRELMLSGNQLVTLPYSVGKYLAEINCKITINRNPLIKLSEDSGDLLEYSGVYEQPDERDVSIAKERMLGISFGVQSLKTYSLRTIDESIHGNDFDDPRSPVDGTSLIRCRRVSDLSSLLRNYLDSVAKKKAVQRSVNMEKIALLPPVLYNMVNADGPRCEKTQVSNVCDVCRQVSDKLNNLIAYSRTEQTNLPFNMSCCSRSCASLGATMIR